MSTEERPEGPSGDAQALVAAELAEEQPTETREQGREVLLNMLLPFQRSLVGDLLQEDGLCILAPGVGLHQVVAVLLRLQDARLREPSQRGVVLVLGAAPWQRDALRQELARVDPAAGGLDSEGAHTAGGAARLPAEVTNEVPAAERSTLYHAHACLFVTTRILVVDLLSSRLAARDIAGLLVLNAHRVSDSSGEGFATRLFKEGNPEGWIRAFSDSPSAFAAEFNKVEKVMKALHVRKLYLWPRFQAQVKGDLEARPPELVELSVGMSGAMGLVYDAIAELMDACVKELRKSNKLDTTDLTLDQGLLKSFDEIVRRQLNTVWHTVAPKTKQIVTDLRTLRSLAAYLLRFDPLTFLTYLDSLRVTEGTKSVWLFHSAAHTIFEAAKSRVYRLRPTHNSRKRKAGATGGPEEEAAAAAAADAVGAANGSGSGSGTGAGTMVIETVLEPPPKWELLVEVVEEIQRDRRALLQAEQQQRQEQQQHQQQQEGALEPQVEGSGVATVGAGDTSNCGAEGGLGSLPVLVVCQDAFTCSQLREVLSSGGPGGLMGRLYREYLQYKLDGGATDKPKKPLKEPRGSTARTDAGPGPGSTRLMGGYRPGEEVALLKEAKSLAAPQQGEQQEAPAGVGRGRGRGGRGGGSGRAARGGRGGRKAGGATAASAAAAAAAARTTATTAGRKNLESPPPRHPGSRGDAEQDTMVGTASARGAARGGTGPNETRAAAGTTDATAAPSTGQGAGPGRAGGETPLGGPLLESVEFVCLERHEGERVWEVRPAFVVMYDPDVAFTRQLELYKAESSAGFPLRVYLLRYEDSLEMDKYQAQVERERSVFESLIKSKEIMILPIAPREQVDPARRLPAVHPDLGLLGAGANALTRRAGGRITGKPVPKRIVVDVREFMSSLPAVLHQQGLELVPLTLEVGDYVLSSELCVERKSIADLRGSLASGRLYHQAEAMSKHYRTPLLLIEFEGDKAFALQASSEIADDIQLHSLMSKLALLCLHFPRLRLIWSRSLHATAEMFQTLKVNHEEPDPIAAAAVGLAEAEGGTGPGTGGGEAVVNQSAIDLLRRLPGVTEANWRPLMRSVSSLAELADTPLDTLADIMGGQASPAEPTCAAAAGVAYLEGAAAKKLRDFLDQDCRALFRAL
ncbi:hypothetical protein N2152v2_005944 [Parachlorella kessleri]